jgi:hypothetical protein
MATSVPWKLALLTVTIKRKAIVATAVPNKPITLPGVSSVMKDVIKVLKFQSL